MNLNFSIKKLQDGALKEIREEKERKRKELEENKKVIQEAFLEIIDGYISEASDNLSKEDTVYFTDSYHISLAEENETLFVQFFINKMAKDIKNRLDALGIKLHYEKRDPFFKQTDESVISNCIDKELILSLSDKEAAYVISKDSIVIENNTCYFIIDLKDMELLHIRY